MKPKIRFMATLAKTYSYPVHPDTKERWYEREEALSRAWENYADADDEDKPEYREAIDDLNHGVERRQEPFIAQLGFICQSGVADPTGGKEYLFIHHESWASMPEEKKAEFELCGEDWRPL